ncbi:hypothetical protein HF576_01940 [Microbacterium sp. CFH 90308]|uniref:Uncharacterized protein n=1 Tax=Microbacterium salsuginis TaxID=2722803 RepID=A0ABX1K866_9MICO|nr:hypothetical protein [Microbacterium sp. CFH 90308]NLP82600.1 hypothetical protein [Microbacterium sp. CFH 90308]
MDCTIACQLDRIADAMSGFDWNAFWATLIATIIGALVASLIGLAVARAERPQPFFRVEASQPSGNWWTNRDGEVGLPVELWNIGDGPAYNVRLTITGAPNASREIVTAKLEPGESLRSSITVPGHGELESNPLTGHYNDTRSVTWPAHADALITWQQPPQRHRVRRLRLALTNPFA